MSQKSADDEDLQNGIFPVAYLDIHCPHLLFEYVMGHFSTDKNVLVFFAALWSAGLLALLCVVFSCVFCHFPICIWCLGSGVVPYCIES